MKSIYAMKIRESAPGFNQETVTFTACDYRDAVNIVHQTHKASGHAVSLHSGPHDPYAWHWVLENGYTTDRNGNSGVPEHEFI